MSRDLRKYIHIMTVKDTSSEKNIIGVCIFSPYFERAYGCTWKYVERIWRYSVEEEWSLRNCGHAFHMLFFYCGSGYNEEYL